MTSKAIQIRAVFISFALLIGLGCSSAKLEGGYRKQDLLAASLGPASTRRVKLSNPAEGEAFSVPSSKISVERENLWSANLHHGPINGIAVTSNGRTVFTGGEDGTVLQADFNSGEKELTVSTLLAGPRPILALDLSPDDKTLAVARFSVVFLVDIETRQIIKTQTSLEGNISALEWDKRGESLAIGRSNGDVFLWQVRDERILSNSRLASYTGATTAIVAMAFHPNGNALFVAERGGSVTAWHLRSEEEEKPVIKTTTTSTTRSSKPKAQKTTFSAISPRVEDLWLSESGELIFVAGSDGVIHGWRAKGLVPLPEINLAAGNLFSLVGSTPSLKSLLDIETDLELLFLSGRDARVHLACVGQTAIVPVASGATLSDPLTKLRISSDATLLWGIQKTGNLVGFDLGLLPRLSGWGSAISHCRG